MLRVSLKNLLARKRRLVSTSLAVLLGVAFLTGALVLTDTVGQTFDELFAQVNEGVDAQVRSSEVIETDFGDVRGRIDASLLDEVLALPGVKAADVEIAGYARVVGKDGDPIGNPGQGPPTLGLSWSDIDELNPMNVVEGRPPQGPGEVLVDRGVAKDGDFEIGDRVSVILERGQLEFELVGIATFGNADNAGGTTLTFFDRATAEELLSEPGRVDGISVVAEDGVSQEELRDTLDEAFGDDIEAITGEELTKEQQDEIAEALSFFDTFMLIFALIALFVGAFIIFNTFSIVVAQRTQELGLLRALGASRFQVLASVQVEALAVGLVASVLGILVGLAVASGLKSLLEGFGLDLPASGLVFESSTAVTALLTGVIVTMVSAISPALRAGRISPLAAMVRSRLERTTISPVRVVLGTLVLALGVLLVVLGLFADVGNDGLMLGGGAAIVFLGMSALGPVLARPVNRVLGEPIRRWRGVPGRLATQNIQRNPKRTASSAAALMVGVGLVGFITIFADSAKASINKIIDESFVGDIVIDSGTFGQGGLPTELAERLNELPEVEAASGVRFGFAEIDGESETVFGIDPVRMDQIVDVGLIAGAVADLDETGLAVLDDVAEDNGWDIGDQVEVRFAETGTQTFTVRVLYTENQLAGRFFIGNPAFEANFPNIFDFQVYVLGADGVPSEQLKAAVESVADDFAGAEVQDLTEFKDAQAAQINQLLGLIYVLLALSILIALIGIANTLALGVVERTHELGLLRAVGMARKQLRSSIRWEAVLIALFGGVLGLVVSIFFGWAIVAALEDDGFTELRINAPSLLIILLIAALVGVLAAVRPARRAARLDVLDAIAHE